jgi:adenosylhomocysteine nucleosidase
VASEAREFAGLVPFLARIQRLSWPLDWARRGELRGDPVVLVANGAGRSLAAAAVDFAVTREAVRAVVSVGFCGALDPGLNVGDVFVASEVQTDGGSLALSAPRVKRDFASGLLVSLDRVAQTRQEKRLLRAAGARAVEMEAAGVAERALNLGLPLYCIRAVTDLAGESFGIDLNGARTPEGRLSLRSILKDALLRPRPALFELARLARRSRLATRSLGGFIADCEF